MSKRKGPNPTETKTKATKKQKEPEEEKSEGEDKQVSEEEAKPAATEWPLSQNRKISISDFKGKKLVSIREFYIDKAGDEKPGKKGISLTEEQWGILKKAVPEIDAALK